MQQKNFASILKHRIQLQEPVNTPDGAGGYTTSWSTVATLWAHLTPIALGNETLEEGQLQNVTNFRMAIRYRGDVRPRMRVKYGSRYFNIRSIIDPDEGRWRLDLLVEEGAIL